MKTNYSPRRLTAMLLISSIFAVNTASAALIEVDVSDASAVTFTATNESSSINFNEVLSFGFSLTDFFTANVGGANLAVLASSLQNVNGGQLFNRARTGPSDTSDLNIRGGGGVYTMTTIGPALAGSMTLDLSAFAGSLNNTVGASGSIFFDYDPFTGDTFGTWEIVAVPEPGVLALLGIGLSAIGLARRRRKVA